MSKFEVGSKAWAIEQMLNGKTIIHERNINTKYIIKYTGTVFLSSSGDHFNVNLMIDHGWTIYTEPKPRRKFYRRKWVIDKNDALRTDTNWFASIEKFDGCYSHCELSPEIEEMEV